MIVLKKIAWKPLSTFLTERSKIISDSLASAEKIKKEVYQLKKESEVLRMKTEDEIAFTQNDTKRYIENMLLEAVKKAKADYDLIIEDAMSYIQKLKRDATNEIKRKTGKQIVEIAEKVLRKELSEPRDQESQINRLIKNLKLK